MMRVSLKAARVNKKLRQSDAARALNVTKKTISSWENGKTMPCADKIAQICDLYEVKYDDIEWKVG